MVTCIAPGTSCRDPPTTRRTPSIWELFVNRPCSLTARRAGVGRVVAGGLPAPGYPSVGDGAALAAHLVYVGFTTAPVRDVGLRGGMTERRWLR
uniref:Uncharacterized protein n=1 Tax=Salinispora arenicola (strain CNS-205) TaxID=391037 RepID=A8LXQ4_SALAI